MKRKTSILSGVATVVVLVVAACSTPKFEQFEAPVPSAKMAKDSRVPLSTLGKGYSIYQVNCVQCHELRMPKDMKAKDWHEILPGMAWNSGLEKADEKAVLAYLVAATNQNQAQQKQ